MAPPWQTTLGAFWTFLAIWGFAGSAAPPAVILAAPDAAAVRGIGRNDFSNEESAFNHPVANDKDVVDRGPSDVIHDLHAKYETAVNKAERVAQEAVKFTAESLNEQGQRTAPLGSMFDMGMLVRRKRMTDDSIPEAKLNKMIDLMNDLNTNFATIISHFDLKAAGKSEKGDSGKGTDEEEDGDGEKGGKRTLAEESETTTEDAATKTTAEDEEKEEEQDAKAERVSGGKKWRLSKKKSKSAKRTKNKVKVKVDPEEYEYDEK